MSNHHSLHTYLVVYSTVNLHMCVTDDAAGFLVIVLKQYFLTQIVLELILKFINPAASPLARWQDSVMVQRGFGKCWCVSTGGKNACISSSFKKESANKVKIRVPFAMIIKMSFPLLLQQMRFEAQKSWSNFWGNQLFIRNNKKHIQDTLHL